MREAIEAELAWLIGKRSEPGWSKFPPNLARPRPRMLSGPMRRKQKKVDERPEPDLYADHQAAALWLTSAATLFDVAKRSWLRDIVAAYRVWTFAANGSELEEDEETDHRPSEWNEAFFKLLACCLPGLTLAQADDAALTPVAGLPDEAFFDITTTFLRAVDGVYFSDFGLQDVQAVHVRAVIFKRIVGTKAWRRHLQEPTRTELHSGRQWP